MKTERTYFIRRVLYSLIYLLLIGFPLYRIYLGALICPEIYQYVLLALSSLVIIGLLKDKSELIIIYYVATAIIFQVNNVGTPSAGELLIYSLIILHGDIVEKALIYGVGLRKIRSSIKGYLITATFVSISLIAYLMGGYLSASLFMALEKASVLSTSLSEAVLKPFLNTRVGSLTIIVVSAVMTSYILTEYLGGITSDIIGLNPEYAGRKIKASLTKAYELIISGKTWHDRLLNYSVVTFLSLTLWIATVPAYKLGIKSVPYIMKALSANELTGITQTLSMITGVVLAYLTYRVLRRLMVNVILPKPFPENTWRPKRSYEWLIFPAIILITYVCLVMIYPPMNSSLSGIVVRALGLSPPKPGTSWLFLNSLIYSIPARISQYVKEVVGEFNWLIYIARLVMNILWGT